MYFIVISIEKVSNKIKNNKIIKILISMSVND